MSDISDNLVGVDDLLMSLGQACFATARQLDALNDSERLACKVRYVVPTFKVSVKLSFTKTGDTVKGVLFWKQTEGASRETLSSIDMEIVAVPLYEALHALDAIVGRDSPEEVLNAIFAEFCIGK